MKQNIKHLIIIIIMQFDLRGVVVIDIIVIVTALRAALASAQQARIARSNSTHDANRNQTMRPSKNVTEEETAM
jgi:hypothetical protein